MRVSRAIIRKIADVIRNETRETLCICNGSGVGGIHGHIRNIKVGIKSKHIVQEKKQQPTRQILLKLSAYPSISGDTNEWEN